MAGSNTILDWKKKAAAEEDPSNAKQAGVIIISSLPLPNIWFKFGTISATGDVSASARSRACRQASDLGQRPRAVGNDGARRALSSVRNNTE
jgi:hypothetical protein